MNTAFTSREIRLQLSSLDHYMVQCHHNIQLFNQHVNDLVMSLVARNEDTTDLVTNLLKGYKECADKTFVNYVQRLEDRIDDGETIDANTLMSRCLTKYKMKMQRNEWQAPTAEDEKIIALQAAIKVMEAKQAHKGGGHPQGGGQQPSTSTRPGGNASRRKQAPWMKLPRKTGEPNIKIVDGIEYKHCDRHGWCKHTTVECRNIPTTDEQAQHQPAEQKQEGKPELVFDKALEALIADE